MDAGRATCCATAKGSTRPRRTKQPLAMALRRVAARRSRARRLPTQAPRRLSTMRRRARPRAARTAWPQRRAAAPIRRRLQRWRARSTTPRASARSVPLPPAAFHQRIVKREPQARAGIEPSHDARVTLELRAVTLELAIHELHDVGAFVASCLEVDDPAHAVCNKRAIECHMHERAAVVPCKRELASRIFVRRIEQPAAAGIACDPIDDFAYGC